MSQKYSLEYAKNIAIERNGHCLSIQYLNCDTSLLWKCKVCSHEWLARLSSIIHCGTWCPACAHKKAGQQRRKISANHLNNKDKEALREYSRKYCKKWYQAHKEERKVARKEWYQNNKKRASAIQKAWRIKNKEYIRIAFKQWAEKNKEKRNKYHRDRYANNLNNKIARILRSRLSGAVNNKWLVGSAIDNLGCSILQFQSYLESKFLPGMTWKNWGKEGWHLDHILPLSSFVLSDPEQLKKACHFSNLQPLWATDNLRKSDQILD